MPRPDGSLTTTERGLGWKDHQKPRKALLPSVIGTPCPRCGVTLTKQQGRKYRPSDAEFDHSRARRLGGLHADRFLCARCNRQLGAILRNKIKAASRRRLTAALSNASRSW